MDRSLVSSVRSDWAYARARRPRSIRIRASGLAAAFPRTAWFTGYNLTHLPADGTHGVGAMRKYSIGAVLLDKDDPSKVIGRTKQPILEAARQDREGYVPNVVYSCGAIRHGDMLFIPYGVADSSVAFAFVKVGSLLKAM